MPQDEDEVGGWFCLGYACVDMRVEGRWKGGRVYLPSRSSLVILIDSFGACFRVGGDGPGIAMSSTVCSKSARFGLVGTQLERHLWCGF